MPKIHSFLGGAVRPQWCFQHLGISSHPLLHFNHHRHRCRDCHHSHPFEILWTSLPSSFWWSCVLLILARSIFCSSPCTFVHCVRVPGKQSVQPAAFFFFKSFLCSNVLDHARRFGMIARVCLAALRLCMLSASTNSWKMQLSEGNLAEQFLPVEILVSLRVRFHTNSGLSLSRPLTFQQFQAY